jgi:hypothetical protein
VQLVRRSLAALAVTVTPRRTHARLAAPLSGARLRAALRGKVSTPPPQVSAVRHRSEPKQHFHFTRGVQERVTKADRALPAFPGFTPIDASLIVPFLTAGAFVFRARARNGG